MTTAPTLSPWSAPTSAPVNACSSSSPAIPSTSRIIGERRWFLGASTEWPGVIQADVELGKPELLAEEFPNVAADIRNYPQPVN